ncbi:SecA-related protein [Oceanospirillum sp. MED92]|uniref:SecA-related protein n=2 Tax=Neptuniibacter caesariensis TaxID=207954 RepID=A0A7U8GT27_NEPCE|nr:SecA-related protein [Oceanospirillum sp. MED92] [Neptuniibacter caesariensis]
MSGYFDLIHQKLPSVRSEREVFQELEKLCKSPGFIHVIATVCLREYTFSCDDELSYEHLADHYSSQSLLRTEISLITCLMLKGEQWDKEISVKEINHLLVRTEEVLQDLHASIFKGLGGTETGEYPKGRKWLKEAIFYAGESAYGSQYIDLSKRRYIKDNQWFVKNKNFTIEQAICLYQSIYRLLNSKLNRRFPNRIDQEKLTESVLPLYSFAFSELVEESAEKAETIRAFLKTFTIEGVKAAKQFSNPTDFNPIDAQPIIRCGDHFILLQAASLCAALYEAPFYWLIKDKEYYSAFISNRGAFTEEFAAERLERVFGKERVYRNVTIEKSKKETVDEIDVLVIYGDRAIVLQAKSKRLTLKAKQGDEHALEKDFFQAVQIAYDQAFSCAESLKLNKYRLVTESGEELKLKNQLKEIYPVCVISDHYPSLNSQVDSYLVTRSCQGIQPPYVMDVFFLDIISEFLTSPLHFLNYINLRVNNRQLVVSEKEHAVFAMHLTSGLRHSRSDKDPVLVLGGHSSIPVDIAFLSRREGYPGEETPTGILTRGLDSPIQRLIKSIDVHNVPEGIQLGLFLLQLYPQDQASFDRYYSEMLRRAKDDGRPHDFTLMPENELGMTIHINPWPDEEAYEVLVKHCENRKYKEGKDRWLGLCICPWTEEIKFGVDQDYPWEASQELDDRTRHMKHPKELSNFRTFVRPTRKVGRNDKCYCGSGKKYKICCY